MIFRAYRVYRAYGIFFRVFGLIGGAGGEVGRGQGSIPAVYRGRLGLGTGGCRQILRAVPGVWGALVKTETLWAY